MMRLDCKVPGSRGFTLVEIIVTLVVMGWMVLLFVNFMGTAQTNSWQSVEFVAGEAAAEAKMEEVIAYFTSKINSDPDTALNSVLNEDFGSDVAKDYITYDGSGQEVVLTSGTSNNLRITVEAPGNNITTILTKSRVGSGDPIAHY